MAICVTLHTISSRATNGHLRLGTVTFPCAIGSGGIRVRKREGDGATPAGFLRLIALFYRRDHCLPPRSSLTTRALRATDGWSDDPRRLPYNRLTTLPFAGSHERMQRDDRLYDVVGVLDYNMTPAVRGRGSAIFFHLTRNRAQPPTAGCIAIEPSDMAILLTLSRGQIKFVVPPVTARRTRSAPLTHVSSFPPKASRTPPVPGRLRSIGR